MLSTGGLRQKELMWGIVNISCVLTNDSLWRSFTMSIINLNGFPHFGKYRGQWVGSSESWTWPRNPVWNGRQKQGPDLVVTHWVVCQFCAVIHCPLIHLIESSDQHPHHVIDSLNQYSECLTAAMECGGARGSSGLTKKTSVRLQLCYMRFNSGLLSYCFGKPTPE